MTKTNITLKLDADLPREARIIAAEEGRSVNALVTERLASTLYTEDLSDGQHYGSVRVENPLVDHVHEPQSPAA